MLPILYQSDNFIAIDKPAGLLVHRSPLDPRERRFALQLLRDQIGQDVHPCHRLDKPTSGVLLFALNKAALREAQDAFAEGRAAKTYQAVVRGWTDTEGVIEYALRPKTKTPGGMVIGDPQDALSRYRRLATSELPIPLAPYATLRLSHVEVRPETGRTHQIRRHFQHISHPVVGDTKHGKGALNRIFREHFDCRRMLLAATDLRLQLPGYPEEPLEIHADPAPDFLQVLEAAGLRNRSPHTHTG